MKRKGFTFRKFYLAYLLLLTIGVIAALTYVNRILHQYEEARPERYVEQAIDTLIQEASDGTLWSKYTLPQVEAGKFEKHLDVQSSYLALYADGEVTFSQKSGTHNEDELYYNVENNGVTLAEVKLKAKGPTVTKLAILSYREWQIEYVKPLLEAKEYTLSVPTDFRVCVNGIDLTLEDSTSSTEKEVTYQLENIYLEPMLDIKDQKGNAVAYTIQDGQVIVEFYNYSLTLPAILVVKVNGENYAGEALEDNRIHYQIRSLTKPLVTISDYYGNEVTYEGGDQLPLTYMTISADSRYTIEVSGTAVSREAISTSANPEYAQLTDYVENLPQINVFHIAVLENNAEIVIRDENGNPVPYDTSKTTHDFTAQANGLDSVPDEVTKQVDVLNIAQQWSLFMSNDVPFSEVAQHLVLDSYQYEMAKRYATGTDITFTSEHSLMNPAFTDSSVQNFMWLTDMCFSVDISFVKHMQLRTGTRVDDPMNDRFYFVKYDDTNDNTDNPTWKIASMKEIVNNE